MSILITSNPAILGGTPCFTGTRVPVESLFDHLRRGYSLDYFLAQFPTVARNQAESVLDLAKEHLARPTEVPGEGPDRRESSARCAAFSSRS